MWSPMRIGREVANGPCGRLLEIGGAAALVPTPVKLMPPSSRSIR